MSTGAYRDGVLIESGAGGGWLLPRSTWRPSAVFALLLGDFVLLGVTIGVQGVLWASLMSAIGAGKAAFGTAQLASPLISIALLLMGGHLSVALGKKRLGIASLLLLGSSSLALAGSASLWAFVGALVVLGAGNGLFETAMNGAALDWEEATGRSALNVLHAGFSAGAIVSALGAGALLGVGWPPGRILIVVALLCGVALVATLPVRYPSVERRGAHRAKPGSIVSLLVNTPALAGLTVVCMLGAVGESIANIWSVIYLVERGAAPMLGGTAFALLSAAMLVGRLANARVLDRVGPRGSLWASGAGLVLSGVLLVIPGGVWLAIVGLALLGLAVAGVVPTVLTAAARLAPGSSGAVAAGILASAYVSFTISPPLVGWLAETVSLQSALATVGVSGLGILWLTRKAGEPLPVSLTAR